MRLFFILPGFLLPVSVCFGQPVPGAGVTLSTGATFGEVLPLNGAPSDIVLDESRSRIYLVQSGANRVLIYNYGDRRLEGQFDVGAYPSAAAISMDSQFLYVTNVQSATLSVINLESGATVQSVSLPARPEGVEVGFDGRVLITTQGAGANNQLNTLLVYDPTLEAGQSLFPVPAPPPISTPNPLPAVFVGRPATEFPGRLIRTPDGRFIVGMVAINQTTNNAQTTLFVYEVASATVLRNRTVTGQSTVLALSPDGSRLMAGSTLFDTASLSVVGQVNSANFPFFIGSNNNNPAITIARNFGGSFFSPDGSTLYGSFNVAQNAANVRPVSNYLLVGNPRNLAVRIGIRLPEGILGKIVGPSSGADLFATSESGLLYLPVSKLFEHPIIEPETTAVFLAVDPCNKGIARARVRVNNLGQGKLTYTVPTTTQALVAEVDTGLAPSMVTFSLEPGRTAVQRRPGTNYFTGVGGGNAQGINIVLNSREAVNFPPVIRVYMNYRERDERGVIYPVATVPNNNEGLEEIVLDEPRGRVYISNSGYNRIEVFDTRRLRFLDPIEVGQLPSSMAMSLDRSLLYVGNQGGESISIIDLDLRRVIGNVEFPAIPRAGNQNSQRPAALAMTQAGLQFIMTGGGAGTLWRLIGNQAVPRPASPIISPNSATTTLAAPAQFALGATPDGSAMIALAGNGNAYLYDAASDSFTTARLINQAPIQSYYGLVGAAKDNRFFLANGLVLSPALAVIGGAERPGTIQFGPPAQPGQPPTQTLVSAGQRHIASVYAIDESRFVRLTIPVRQNLNSTTRDDPRGTIEMVDTRTSAETLAAIAPDSPQFTITGQQRIGVPARQMVVDSAGTAYVIGLSGLSVIPLQQTGTVTPRPAITGGSRGIVNAVNGSTNFTPGSFITISGTHLASPGVGDQLPLGTVLGGSCVTFSDVPLPLIETSPGQITAQVPDSIRPGLYVVQVRSLANAVQSDTVTVTVQRP